MGAGRGGTGRAQGSGQLTSIFVAMAGMSAHLSSKLFNCASRAADMTIVPPFILDAPPAALLAPPTSASCDAPETSRRTLVASSKY